MRHHQGLLSASVFVFMHVLMLMLVCVQRIKDADSVYGEENGWRQALSLFTSWVTKDLSSAYAGKVLDDDKLLIDWVESHKYVLFCLPVLSCCLLFRPFLETQLAALRQTALLRDAAKLFSQAQTNSATSAQASTALVQTLAETISR